ncbi:MULTISPECIES: DUF3472 domain-containing protein [Chryseobacterium]|uniref:DUF3472 domain-containing protein n=1 Tax=Chryseobacterium TaxID=59732 RepID=UPI0013DDFD44|nr:DUF3472 domain-containing protein [Chryseobacterium bernardetii]
MAFNIDITQFPEYKDGDKVETNIVPDKDSVYVMVPWYVGKLLRPNIEVSSNATVAPISGSVTDFSQENIVYTVRAANGNKKEWKIALKWLEEPEPFPRNETQRRFEGETPKYKPIKFGLWGNAYSSGSGLGLSRSGNATTGYIQNNNSGPDPTGVHTIYFVARHAGELQLALAGRTGSGGTSPNGEQINVKAYINGLPAKDDNGTTDYNHSYRLIGKTTATDTVTLHRIIIPEIPAGNVGVQVKLEIRGVGLRPGSGNSSYYYRFYELWLNGWATRGDQGALFNGKKTGISFSYATPRDGIAAPSIHMNMTAPTGNMEYFYTEVTVPPGGDPLYTYYMTSGNGQGYAGIQTNSATERRFLFSIWAAIEESDPSALKVKYNPKIVRVCNQPQYRPGITYSVFGGEGTGGQSYLNVKWETGKTYKVLLRIRPHPDQVRFPNSTLYKAWFHNGTEWIFMCEWRRQEVLPGDKGVTQSTVKGPYWYTSAGHFIEDFNGQMGAAEHKAYFTNHWFITDQGQYVEPINYIFTGDQAQGRADVAGGVISSGEYANAIYMRSGGYFTDYTSFTNPFTKPSPAIKPQLDLIALNAMGTDDPSVDSKISPGERYTEK